ATTYTLDRKVGLFVNTVTSFTSKPLVYICYVGLLISLVAGLATLSLVFQWLFLSRPSDGWTSVMASIWLLGGWIILILGIIGIYLSKMFLEIKQRPYTIVRRVHGARVDGE
ncbi:MAG TPA: glycosyltransferase, partial [Luteimonas sp.]|nr:glycosyltransferase [Luteimonas sp.]